MHVFVSLLIPLVALLLRLTGRPPSPAGRHAASGHTPESPEPQTRPGGETPPLRRSTHRPRPYAKPSPPAPAPSPRRIPDRDAFYRLAELTRHSGIWGFTYDHGALAPYVARHRVDPAIIFAASSVAGLEAVLDMLDPPAMLRPYAAATRTPAADDAAHAAAERAALDSYARAGVAR
ncbi:hypothetical protein GCM10009799_20750 [Nocardiopsis rhodophaea]|uniref:Uncharacterized protein n=1 Tax=Nocardiopsis rhodophaea TaxID=280238 RepID=A0ABN2SXU8_9ACTN